MPNCCVNSSSTTHHTTRPSKSDSNFLDWQSRHGPAGRSQAYVNLSRGWAIGSTDFRAALIQDHALVARTRAWESIGAAEIRSRQWNETLIACFKIAGLEQASLRKRPKSAPDKITLAAFLKTKTQASNAWLCRELNLGHPGALSHNLTAYRRTRQQTDALWQKLTSQYST